MVAAETLARMRFMVLSGVIGVGDRLGLPQPSGRRDERPARTAGVVIAARGVTRCDAEDRNHLRAAIAAAWRARGAAVHRSRAPSRASWAATASSRNASSSIASMPEIARTREVHVGDVTFGGERPFALIAGPCVIESREHCLRHAEAIQRICRAASVPLVFKSSFDKANRTSGGAFRGLGLDAGLAVLAEVRRNLGVPVLTDVHEREQCKAAGEVVDCLQIPAFLCRQTDLLLAAVATGRAVNV